MNATKTMIRVNWETKRAIHAYRKKNNLEELSYHNVIRRLVGLPPISMGPSQEYKQARDLEKAPE